MTFSIHFSEEAYLDLLDIFGYVAKYDLKTADDYCDKLEKHISLLSIFPYIGKKYNEEERFLVFDRKYLIFYSVNELTKQVEIVTIVHGKKEKLRK
ncbi:MAG: type II toxin-antitoxin system RelE/ParE family toxin [Firmicutes bacterium]|nr:type II toxin-antitoxin system RelE/ParE family toxin [Bacillota bacterium]